MDTQEGLLAICQEGEIKDKVSKLCEKFTETVFKYIKRSNFDLAIAECYFDLAVGTACLMVNEGTDEDPLRFHSVPMNQLCVEDSINGMINTVYRTYGEVRIIDIPMMWPKAKLPVWAEALLEQDPNVTIKNLYEGVVYIQENEPTPFRVVLWCDSDILMEYDDVSSPWIVFRWSKINNEAMGRGPLMDALPSILSLNELARLELTSANLNVCKPYMAYSDGVFSPYLFNLQPNTIIPIAPNAAGQFPIQPLPDVANPQFFQMTSMDLRQQINNLLYANPLGQANDGPTRTATELALRQRNLSEEIGPVFTRLQSELLDRVINRIVYILKKKGLIEPIVINGRELDLKYQSPLVVAQGQLEVQGFLQYFQAVQGVYGPEGAITTLNPGYVQYWMAEKLGVDMRLLADRDKFNASLKSNSEQYQQAQLDSLAAPAGLPGTVPQ